MQGIDEELGQELITDDSVNEERVVDFGEAKKRRKAFHIWNVGDNEYKLKLTTSNICMLEEKYKRNLLDIVSMGSFPPLNIMLTIIQAAMLPWHHGIKYKAVQDIYERYVEEGGSQTDLVSNVLMPTMAVSGFFTPDQAESMEEKLQEESLL
uniref:DUF6096 family protein n=1 Tax=Faecalicatena contorta TaxID=39482 RepID=UPI0029234B63|nr:tail chaperone protein [uncultured phage]